MVEFNIFIQELEPGALVLLLNSTRDGRKGDKLAQCWLGPYRIEEHIGRGVYRLANPATGRVLKKAFNGCRYVFTHVAHYIGVRTGGGHQGHVPPPKFS